MDLEDGGGGRGNAVFVSDGETLNPDDLMAGEKNRAPVSFLDGDAFGPEDLLELGSAGRSQRPVTVALTAAANVQRELQLPGIKDGHRLIIRGWRTALVPGPGFSSDYQVQFG